MLDLGAEAVKDLCSACLDHTHILIGELKIVGGGVGGILRPIGEDKIHVHGMLSAVGGEKGGVVSAGKGDAGCLVGLDVGDALISGKFIYGTVIDAVHGLYLAERGGKIDDNVIHKTTILFCFIVNDSLKEKERFVKSFDYETFSK